MKIGLSEAVRNDRSQAIVNALDASATEPGYLEVYTGPMPDSGAAITTQTLLGTLEFSDPAGTVATGQLTFNAISDDPVADASGDIAWVRGFDGDGNWVIDLDAGDSNSNAVVKFVSVSVIAGGIIKLTSGTLIEGNP